MNGTTLTTPIRIVPRVALIDSRVSSTQQVADGRLFVRIARTTEDVEAALKLRFEVFNLELGEGLASAFRWTSTRTLFNTPSRSVNNSS